MVEGGGDADEGAVADEVSEADKISVMHVGDGGDEDDAIDEAAAAAGPDGIGSGRRRMPPALML